MLVVWVDNVVKCPQCGCEETALAFRDGARPVLACHGCEGHWPVVIGVELEAPREEGPRHPGDAQ